MASNALQTAGGNSTLQSQGGERDSAATHQKMANSSPLIKELLSAARKGSAAEVEQLLSKVGGTGAAVVDKHGRNCLHIAARYGYLDTVQSILKSGLLDINSTNRRGNTSLHEAVSEGHLPVVLLLIANGAFLKARSKEGETALMAACKNGHLQLAKVLIAVGADVTLANKKGYTSLHFAACKGHTSLVEYLITTGASITAEAANGKTPLQLSQEEHHHEIATILQASLSKESDDPFYRVAFLEGQLHLCQDKLKELQLEHETALAATTESVETKWSKITQELSSELEGCKTELRILQESKHHKRDRDDLSVPKLTVNDAEPEHIAAKEHKAKLAKDPLLNVLQEDLESRRASTGTLFASPVLKHKKPPKSSSEETLDIFGLDRVEQKGATKSSSQEGLHGKTSNNTSRPSISQLIEESMSNPQSMLSIKQQLKSDGFTPKIKRKFQRKLPEPVNSTVLASLPLKNSATTKKE